MHSLCTTLLSLVLLLALTGCPGSTPIPDTGADGGVVGPDVDAGRQDEGAPNTTDSGPLDAGSVDAGPLFGHVRFTPLFETGTPWDTTETQEMARAILDEIADLMHTAGSWDAEIVVFFTSVDEGFGYTTFENSGANVDLNGAQVRAVRAWQKVVLGHSFSNSEAAQRDDADFVVHVNIAENADNPGLIRHEAMHGLGAVGIGWPAMSEADVLSGLVPGDSVGADVYALNIVDRNGDSLLGEYDDADERFTVQDYTYDPTFAEWTDGEAGLFFRGVDDDGQRFDMPLGTGPGSSGALLRLNEPSLLMSAGAHPNWDHVDAPDRAFLRAMGYPLHTDD